MSDAIDRVTFANLVEMTGGEMDFVDELVDTFLEDGRNQVEALRVGARSGDLEELIGPSHALKSSSLSVGAMEVGALSRALEEAARLGPVPEAADRVEAIVAAFDAARDALLDERRRRTQG
jgi:HPt (histidine-containing phosphotransfer) domain-containing protein